VYSPSGTVYHNTIEFEKELGEQAWNIYNAAEECDKMRQSETTWNANVLLPLLDQVVTKPQYKGAVGRVDMYAMGRIFKLLLTNMHTAQAPKSRPCLWEHITLLVFRCKPRWLTGAFT